MKRLLILLSIFILSLYLPAHADAVSSANTQFAKAVSYINDKKFSDAIPILEELAVNYPTSNLFWNLGIAAVEVGDYKKAEKAWLNLRSVAPDDWRVYSKLVQTYQALGDIQKRDEERTRLIELWKSGKHKELSQLQFFCREQFNHNGQLIVVFEYFAPSGNFMVKYSFYAPKPTQEDGFKITLGSYESTTITARELGNISKDQRIYHLDLYKPNRHETHQLYVNEPIYEAVRKDVISVLGGAKSMSSSSRRQK
jgi:tetratricopeptide (TPR) repeat protein